MFLPQELIRKKRDGHLLTESELANFFGGYLQGKVADYQMSAMLMAIFLKGMSPVETANLTTIMRDSGEVFSWQGGKQHVVDKHSTGGVGDKTSLVLAPLVALENVRIPMMAGRGLGHTGGTLDKLAAIGVDVFPSPDKARRQIEEVGCVFMGQTEAMAPLDQKLYALRDVTATVESIPLIVGSILSKKLAEGLGGLVMDVKFGTGAFMETFAHARALANALVAVGSECGCKVRCLLTDMSSPLGTMAGNAIEVLECIEIMQGEGPEDTRDLILELGTEMVRLAFPERNHSEIRLRLEDHLTSGRALEKFRQVVIAQGGDVDFLDHPEKLRAAPIEKPVLANRSGFVQAIDVRQLGIAILEMGGGRKRTDDDINPWVGLIDLRKQGDEVQAGDILATVLGADAAKTEHVVRMVQEAYIIGDEGKRHPLIAERIG